VAVDQVDSSSSCFLRRRGVRVDGDAVVWQSGSPGPFERREILAARQVFGHVVDAVGGGGAPAAPLKSFAVVGSEKFFAWMSGRLANGFFKGLGTDSPTDGFVRWEATFGTEAV